MRVARLAMAGNGGPDASDRFQPSCSPSGLLIRPPETKIHQAKRNSDLDALLVIDFWSTCKGGDPPAIGTARLSIS